MGFNQYVTHFTISSGGWGAYLGCMALVGVGGFGGFLGSAAILGLLGFTASGIAAGSWAAYWMASFSGVIPADSLFAYLQSLGATVASFNIHISFASVSAFCWELSSIF